MECAELDKLINYLDTNNIEYEDQSDDMIERIHFKNNKNKIISVIHGYGTYGGYNRMESDKGLLEVMTWKIDNPNRFNDPDGYLTAEDVINKYISEEF